jgi:glycosyltransferase involved in cell wall biosynthesis
LKRLLMVAFQFPPFAGSSGVQRTLRFVQHLPNLGWEPIVLTAHSRAYEETSEDLLAEIPAGVIVERAFALDTARHLSILRRYPGFLARPDRWRTWAYDATTAGMRLVAKYHPAAIWSTYPIATAHIVGARLQQRSRLPWVADFRDPMAQDGYPADAKTWHSYRAIEEDTLHRAARSVFTTRGAARLYLSRYPDIPPERVTVIENGYDEESFVAAEQECALLEPLSPGRITVLHSGVVYPSERDPTQLFAALRRLEDAGRISPGTFCLRLRAPGHERVLAELINQFRLSGLIEIAPPLPYRQALCEMLRADALLALQAANCNEQVPAKIYEYLRAGRPVLGLTDPAGDTARVLRDAGMDSIARLDSESEITGMIERFLEEARRGQVTLPKKVAVAGASRRARAVELVRVLDDLICSGPA